MNIALYQKLFVLNYYNLFFSYLQEFIYQKFKKSKLYIQ